MQSYLEQFDKEGCVVIPNFLSRAELQSIKDEVDRIVSALDVSHKKTAFKTTDDQVDWHDKYFLDSADRISYFFEADAIDHEGNLTVPRDLSLNKMGHALHWDSEVFKKISFKDEVKSVVKSLNFVEPAIIQSMYIFKHPRVGAEVTAHTDCTFLHNEPCKLVGLWFAVENVTLENGCLSYIPGSHKSETVTRRMVRRGDDSNRLEFIGDQREFAAEEFVPVPVEAGGLVLIHGKVVHKSERNLSSYPRPAYTFHVIDMHESVYSPDNWLQPTERLPFTRLFAH
ncbi:phytanoyl-CoA dioxygenase domain-containing protein 1 [Galendromus occidentalis]|uniref:Phytanoyl-CoA dioxygenase domain-containing protein 1 n=1 Tax=Galendromus occidentalis TaxID=34638 RepID=A0AAJ6QM21_9ACAR|nr:phytanoyl-CoA dioxygenase domain-containing protein 1 [Galendromus occidentalis]